MVGAGRRKARLPRKILRVTLNDGSFELQPQLNELNADELNHYDNLQEDSDYVKNGQNGHSQHQNGEIEGTAPEEFNRNGDDTLYNHSNGFESPKFLSAENPKYDSRYDRGHHGRYEGSPENGVKYRENHRYRHAEKCDTFPDIHRASLYENPRESYPEYHRVSNLENDQDLYKESQREPYLEKYSKHYPESHQETDRGYYAEKNRSFFPEKQRDFLKDIHINSFSEKYRDPNTSHIEEDKHNKQYYDHQSDQEHKYRDGKVRDQHQKTQQKSKYRSNPNRTIYKHQHPEPTPEFPYQCETCDMLFKSMEVLLDHQTTVHDNNRQFACRYCSKRFNDKYNMRKHVLIHVGERRHRCQFCDKAFLRKDHLRSHLQTHYNRKFGCKFCGKGFRTMELYQRHLKTHKEEIRNNNPELLEPHIINSGGIEDTPRSENGDSSPQRSSPPRSSPPRSSPPRSANTSPTFTEDKVSVTILDEELDFSNPFNQSSPSISENDMSMADSPLHHDSAHSEMHQQNNLPQDSALRCKQCNKSFEDAIDLQKHEETCIENVDKKSREWQCTKCSIVFDESATLKQHYEKVHSGDHPFVTPSRWRCKSCDINYPNSKELSRHYAQAHKDAQLFPCSECPKTFTVWHNLKKHMLIHLGDKKHKCKVCDKGFVRKDHLNSHMKVHMGDGSKYVCNICNKVFRLRQMYFKHMNLHGLEQAYTMVQK